MKNRRLHFVPLVLLLGALGAVLGRAQGVSALKFPTPTNLATTPSRLNLGYEFSVSTAMQVTALSFYDYNGDGLNVSHPVGLWAGPLNLATVTVTTTSPLQDSFRSVTLAMPIALSPGVTYTLGAFTHTDAQSPGDPFYSVVAGVSYAPGFMFGRALSSGVDQNGLAMPTVDQALLNPGYFGPSVQLAPLVTIPEPATWMTILGGAGALLAVSSRRRAAKRI